MTFKHLVAGCAALTAISATASNTAAAINTASATNATTVAAAQKAGNTQYKKTTVKKLPNGTLVVTNGKNISIVMPQLTKEQRADQAHHEFVTTGVGSPTGSIAAPNAFGSAGTIVFANASYVNHWPTSTANDGFGGVGISAGDPHKYLGVLVSANLGSLGFNNSSFGSNGGVSLRLNRYLNPTTAVAIGTGNLFGWGAYNGISESYYASITKSFFLLIPVTANIGIGSGSFNNAITPSNSDSAWYPYASMGFGIFKDFSLLADWTSRQVNLGGAYTITYFKKVPIFVGAYAMNVNGTQNSQTYFQGTVGAAYRF